MADLREELKRLAEQMDADEGRGQIWAAACAHYARALRALAAQPAPADRENEGAELQLIRERDNCESVIDKILDLVLGSDRREWSNLYDYADAIEEVEERMAELERQPAPAGEVAMRVKLWQSIDSAPKDGAGIFALLPDSNFPVGIRFRDGRWHVAWDNSPLGPHDQPRLWMHIPDEDAIAYGDARAAAAASRPATAVPEGWQLVPREPTQEMLARGVDSIRCDVRFPRPQIATATRGARNAWVSMLSAAPQPEAKAGADDDWHLRGYAYASKQATNCAGCGQHKHTPLRIDAMGGYVWLTCIDQKLGTLLGEFGYPEPKPAEGGAVDYPKPEPNALSARAIVASMIARHKYAIEHPDECERPTTSIDDLELLAAHLQPAPAAATRADVEALAADVIALAKEREDGYRNREHGAVVNGRVADKLVELARRLAGKGE